MQFRIKQKKRHLMASWRATDEQKSLFDACMDELGGGKTDTYNYLLYFWSEQRQPEVKKIETVIEPMRGEKRFDVQEDNEDRYLRTLFDHL